MEPRYEIRFIDLFCGIGGFHLALNRVGGQCVFAAEIDKSARAAYQANFEKYGEPVFAEGRFVEDVTTIKAKDVPDFDLMCAGFPCQPFSQAGRQLGFEDTRGTLFFDIVRIIKEKRPAAYFLENVRNLTRHDGGRTIKTIERVLLDLGYTYKMAVVRASDFGLPQHRPRVFIVGFDKKRFGDIDFSFPKPFPKEGRTTMAKVFSRTLGTDVEWCEKEIGWTLRVGGRGSPHGDKHNWDSYAIRRAAAEKSEIVQIGPTEGKLMLGFPEDWVVAPTITQAMKQLGNSVAVPAVEAVARRIVEIIAVAPEVREAA